MYEDVLAQVPLFSDLTRNELQVLAVNVASEIIPLAPSSFSKGRLA